MLTSFSLVIGQSPPAFFIFFLSFQSSVFLVSCIEILNGLWYGPPLLHTDTLDHLLFQIILYGRLQTVTIPEAVIIQFVLLKMSKVLLETCSGL